MSSSSSSSSSSIQPGTIIYTQTDEAPALATYALLPVVQAFAKAAGVRVETRDISLSGRTLAAFSDQLPASQRVPDALKELGELCLSADANIVKLPNVSASVPQLKATIAELQKRGVRLPPFVDAPSSPAEKDAAARYAAVLGSAVNPVLRQGNSDRRAPRAVKEYVRKFPPQNKPWKRDAKTHVASMAAGDFYGTERSFVNAAPRAVRIEHVDAAGATTVLSKKPVKLDAGDVVDASFVSVAALDKFLVAQIADAHQAGVLFSVHLKATMMKVSDPIIFGRVVRAFFQPVFDKHAAALAQVGADANQGWGAVLERIATIADAGVRAANDADIKACLAARPALAMVDSSKGITNLHVPSDVIIDASMPVVIRDSGCMWNAANKLQEVKCVVPDRCYAGVYQAVIDDCRANGAYDATKIGSVANVGLMAQKAEEYGSHDKTFQIKAAGTVRIVDDASGKVLLEHTGVGAGDVWRACITKDAPIVDWIKLAVQRARLSNTPAVFWLDKQRAHDAQLIALVQKQLKTEDTKGLTIEIMSPIDATKYTVARLRRGEDTISVTGNVLRDYLTDLFPIIEVGTSARMLSIVPLLKGGGLFETGAGGSAPKHVQQLVEANHLRWDSLGEYMALAASIEHLANRYGNEKARVIGKALDDATAKYLLEGKTPTGKVGQLDNRGATFYITLFWAQAIAKQTQDAALAKTFAPAAQKLAANETTILAELVKGAGSPVELGGYYRPEPAKVAAIMRPSATLNAIIDSL
jgi:isocitrate dehydrogenase